MSYGALAFAVWLAIVAMVAIIWRLVDDYATGQLTTRMILTRGALFCGVFGLFMAGVRTLLFGPAF